MIYIIYSFLTIILIIITYKNYFMSNQVVTIGYLKDFVNGKLTVSTDMPDTYCPTYGELTGGALVPNYSSASNPKDTVNGINIPKCTVDTGYTSNQLVIRQDLLLKYMVLDSISINADSTDIDKCGGSTNICVTGTFHLVTKSEEGSEDGSSETDTTIPVTWSDDADNSGPSTCTVISFDLNAVSGIGTDNPISAPARTESTTATYTYKGTNLTSDNDTTKTSNTVTITQGANNVGDWYHVSSEDVADRLVASCPTSIVSENGGTASMSTTLEYRQRWKADDSCGNIVGLKYVPATKSGPGDSHTFEEQECDADARTHTLSASLCGLTASCTAEQEASSVPCFCGGGCEDVGCSGESHWGCAMKKGETEYEYYCNTATVNGLDEKNYLPAAGGTATVTIKGKSKKGIWTRSASCGYENLPTQIVTSLPSLPNSESSQNTIYLLVNEEGKTGGTLYYYDSNGNRQSTYSYTYTSYTQYHYTVWLEDVTIGKKTIKEERWGWQNIGTSYKKDANSTTSYTERGYTYTCGNGYYANCDDKRNEYITDGNSASSWDSAYEVWYEKYQKYMDSERFFCDGVEVATEEEMLNCTGEQERRLNETLNPGYFSIYGYYMSPGTVYGDGDDVDMNSVYACCVRNISTEYNKLVEHLSNVTDIETTLSFSYDANDTDTPKPGTATVTLPNGKTCSVSYTVGNGKSKFELSSTDTTVEPAAAEAYVTVTSKKDDKPYPTFTFSESCDWVSDLTINNPESTNGSYTVQATLVPNTSTERKCEVTVSQTDGKTDKFTITQKGKQGSDCMTISYTLTQGAACTVYFKTTNGTQQGSHEVDATGNQQLCNIAPGTELVVSCSDTAVTIGGDTQFTYTHDSTASISLTKTGGGGGGDSSRVCMDVVVTNEDKCSGDLLFKNASGVKIDECSIDNGAAVTFCYNKGETVYISMRDIDGTSCQLQNGGTSFTVIEGGTVYITISCGDSGGSTTCTTSNTWNSISADVSAAACTTSPTVTVTASGTHTNADCSSVATSTTISDYTIKYGTTSGSYTLDNITQNTGSTSKTWHYSVTGGTAYGSKTTTGTFTQAGGCSTSCTCSITSISVSPSSHTFTSCGNKSITVTVSTNGCDQCTKGWVVYEGDTVYTSGTTSSFSVPNKTASYTIKSLENTSKTCTLSTTVCTASTSTTWSSISVTNVSAGKCDEYASMTVTANGTHTKSNCCTEATSTTLTSSDYTVKYGTTSGSYTLDKIEKNETTSAKTWHYQVTASPTYGSKTATGSFTQASGKCTPDPVTCTTSNTWSSISAEVSADKCTTSPTVTVTASGTHKNTDCSTSGTSTTLSSTEYTIKYGTTSGSYTLDSITQNTGSTSKTWHYQVTANSTYGSKTTTGTFTQAGGCKEYTGSSTVYEMRVVDTTVDKCAETAPSITVQGRSRIVSGYSDGSKTSGDPTNWDVLIKNTDYTINIPTISKNTGSTSKEYTVTATGKGNYNGKSATGKITQAGGCVTAVTEYNNIISYTFPYTYGGYLHLTVTVNNETITSGIKYSTGSSASNVYLYSFKTKEGDSVDITFYGIGYLDGSSYEYLDPTEPDTYGGDWDGNGGSMSNTSSKNMNITCYMTANGDLGGGGGDVIPPSPTGRT